MVLPNGKIACAVLLGAALMIAAADAVAQAATPQAPASSPAAPAASNGPLHWRAQGNTVQPVPPSGASGNSVNPQPPAAVAPSAAAPQGAAATQPHTTAPVAQVSTSPRRKSAHSTQPQVAEAPTTPAPPPTLDQQPPTPPQVRYQSGELTIDAKNSTLAQVLRAVQVQTGASIDVPAGANDRVATQIGPGLPRDVLNTLLNGSKYDYVILGVLGDPGAVQKVILTPRQGGAAGTATAQNNAPTAQPPDNEADEGVPVADSEPENQNPEPPQPPGGFRRPILPGQPLPQQNNFPPDQSDNGGKTPEQLMQELQQMQQQQQQYQEQLNPANRQPPQ